MGTSRPTRELKDPASLTVNAIESRYNRSMRRLWVFVGVAALIGLAIIAAFGGLLYQGLQTGDQTLSIVQQQTSAATQRHEATGIAAIEHAVVCAILAGNQANLLAAINASLSERHLPTISASDLPPLTGCPNGVDKAP
jgi:Tfp pilus assembly protein PilN